jgi:hypothetical protein
MKVADYTELLAEIANGNEHWSVVAAINFEECCTLVSTDLLQLLPHGSGRVQFSPFRLVSRRASPWSALELVKEEFAQSLAELAEGRGVQFPVSEIEYPTSEEVALDFLASIRRSDGRPTNLLLDISSLPRELGVFFVDALFGLARRDLRTSFPRIFAVHTPPQRVTSRGGLGPFSVGAPRCVYSPGLLQRPLAPMSITALVFPGYEGFEAQLAIDMLGRYEPTSVIAMSCREPSFPESFKTLIANQSLLADVLDGSVGVQYYFSELDANRVAEDVVDRAVAVCRERQNRTHTFLVAPFGPKWSILTAAYARRLFTERCEELCPTVEVLTDVLILPRSQYVSLYSRGAREPSAFEI